jgi:ECF sigma factor
VPSKTNRGTLGPGCVVLFNVPARSCRTLKRGGQAPHVALDEALVVSQGPRADILSLQEAVQRLDTLDQRKSQVVERRFFRWTECEGDGGGVERLSRDSFGSGVSRRTGCSVSCGRSTRTEPKRWRELERL